jgi:hypothetical protein
LLNLKYLKYFKVGATIDDGEQGIELGSCSTLVRGASFQPLRNMQGQERPETRKPKVN